ncbi:hypothetical protein K438DRAFT_1801859 [Mycena galopus ATCC 62051]|nr:hypothetical protein K438DRAFT_1801859 [Mycena galopus ATCC 62051]
MFFRSKSSEPLRLGAGALRCALFLPICAVPPVRSCYRCYARWCPVLGVERVPVSRRFEYRRVQNESKVAVKS